MLPFHYNSIHHAGQCGSQEYLISTVEETKTLVFDEYPPSYIVCTWTVQGSRGSRIVIDIHGYFLAKGFLRFGEGHHDDIMNSSSAHVVTFTESETKLRTLAFKESVVWMKLQAEHNIILKFTLRQTRKHVKGM